MASKLLRVICLGFLALASCVSNDEGNDASPRPSPSVPVKIVTEPAGNWKESGCSLPKAYLTRIRRGYMPGRSPEVFYVPREPNFVGALPLITTHSGPWPYLQKVPLVFYGPGFVESRGPIKVDRDVTLADLAPTLADLVGFDWPKERPGRAIASALVPRAERSQEPALVLVVVWDGGGWDLLNEWPDAWPYLRNLMEKGTSIENATVGSSPSVTPAVHATIGTGAFPKQHGIVDIRQRKGNKVFRYSFPDADPRFLKIPTFADLYDIATGNVAKVGMFAFQAFHLGMIGHGSAYPGGDKDIAVISSREHGDTVTRAGNLHTNPDLYSLPPYVNEIPGFENDVRVADLDDGKLDSKWMGHIDLTDPSNVRHSPAWVRYQTRLLQEIVSREGFGDDDVPDLFFINYKEIDDVGHNWGMQFEEMPVLIKHTDDALRKTTRMLDQEVGKGRWVIAITADHGQAPTPEAVGAWPILLGEMTKDVAEHFGLAYEDLFQDFRPVGFWLRRETLEQQDITLEQISDFLVNYRLEDNVPPGRDIPEQYRERLREPIFAAAFPSDKIDEVWRCATTGE